MSAITIQLQIDFKDKLKKKKKNLLTYTVERVYIAIVYK